MALYQTATPFFGKLPDWVNAVDGARIAAYGFYKGLVKNDDTTFQVTLRDDEDSPIYVPSARRITKTLGRYVCRDLGFTPVGPPGADETTMVDIITAYGDLFNREEFFANFADAKEMGLAQGDFVCYVSADPNKPEGNRINLRFIDPGTYFRRPDPTDSSRTSGAMIVEQLTLNDKLEAGKSDSTKAFIKVQRWVKITDPLHPNYVEQDPAKPTVVNYEEPIWYESVIYQAKDWETEPKVAKQLVAQIQIPGITQLPLYHFRTKGEVGEDYGVSQLEGFERLFFAINQAVTDEDVALAMQGLGVYVTNSTPVDANNEATNWVIGPKRVVELKGEKNAQYFERIPGIDKVNAYQDHIKLLQGQAESTAGISDVALGQIDAALADSGVALAIRFGPVIDEAGRIDVRLLSKLKQLWFDLRQWFQVYEGITFDELQSIEPTVGPALPVDVDKILARYQDLFVNGVIPLKLYLQKLIDLDVIDGTVDDIVKQLQKEADENLARQQAAMAGGTDPGGDGTDPEDATGTGGDRLDAEAA